MRASVNPLQAFTEKVFQRSCPSSDHLAIQAFLEWQYLTPGSRDTTLGPSAPLSVRACCWAASSSVCWCWWCCPRLPFPVDAARRWGRPRLPISASQFCCGLSCPFSVPVSDEAAPRLPGPAGAALAAVDGPSLSTGPPDPTPSPELEAQDFADVELAGVAALSEELGEAPREDPSIAAAAAESSSSWAARSPCCPRFVGDKAADVVLEGPPPSPPFVFERGAGGVAAGVGCCVSVGSSDAFSFPPVSSAFPATVSKAMGESKDASIFSLASDDANSSGAAGAPSGAEFVSIFLRAQQTATSTCPALREALECRLIQTETKRRTAGYNPSPSGGFRYRNGSVVPRAAPRKPHRIPVVNWQPARLTQGP